MMNVIITLSVVFAFVLEPVSMARNAGSIGQAEINRVHDVIGRAMSWNRIPDDVLKWLAIFNKHMALLSCLPTVRNGNCYQSQKFCSVESIKVDGRPIKAQFTVCKCPLKIIVRYRILSNPTWARLLLGIDAEPIVILFDTRKNEGVTKIDSSATAKVRLLGLGSSKLTLKINGLLRWDCTKPRNFLQRLRYNTEYEDRRSGDSFNKIYYKLRVCFEFKVNKLLRFCFRDGKCEDLINVQGDLGEGSQKCNKEVTNAMQWLYNGNPTRGMKVFRRKFAPFKLCALEPGNYSLAERVYLFYLMANPKKYTPGIKIVFAGLKKKRERVDLLEFLKHKKAPCLLDI